MTCWFHWLILMKKYLMFLFKHFIHKEKDWAQDFTNQVALSQNLYLISTIY